METTKRGFELRNQVNNKTSKPYPRAFDNCKKEQGGSLFHHTFSHRTRKHHWEKSRSDRSGCVFRTARGNYSGTYVGGQWLNLAMMVMCDFPCQEMSLIQPCSDRPKHAFMLEFDLVHEGCIVPETMPIRHVFRRKTVSG